MFFVSAQKRSTRLNICHECEHYIKDTKSCGTIGIGNEVVHDGVERKLCGCIMPIKTRLKVGSCPLKKWHAEIHKEDIDEIEETINNIGHSIPGHVNQRLTELWNKTAGDNLKVSACGSCVKKMIEDLQKMIVDYKENN